MRKTVRNYGTILIEEVLTPYPARVEQVKELYFASFPESERTSFPFLLEGIKNGRINLYTAESPENKLLGLAIVTCLQKTGVWCLEYLAVTENFRNQGIGSKMLQFITHELKLKNAPGLIFEIESEDEGPEEERTLRKRRLGFHERNGANAIKCAPHYRMPNLAGDGSLGMRLMWIPILVESLHGSGLERCIIDMYSQLYGREMGDPLLNQILKDLIC